MAGLFACLAVNQIDFAVLLPNVKHCRLGKVIWRHQSRNFAAFASPRASMDELALV
jgi:hypothetical protein